MKKIITVILMVLSFAAFAKETKITDKIAVDTCGTYNEWLGNHSEYCLLPCFLPFSTFVAVTATNALWNNYIEYNGNKYDIPRVDKKTTFLVFEFDGNIYYTPVSKNQLKDVIEAIYYGADEYDLYLNLPCSRLN